MLKAVIFDLDNTLYSYDEAHEAAFAALTDYACRAFGLTPPQFEALHEQATRDLEERVGSRTAAIHNRLLRYQALLERTGRSVSAAPRMSELYWSTLLDHMRPFPGMTEALKRLKAMGLQLGVGTNMVADRQFDKLERLGVMPLMDFIVTSEEVGAEKPDAKLFEWCARKAGCAPERCLFVGDSLRGDVYGALGAGMLGLWLRGDRPKAPGIPSIQTLDELPGWVAAMI